MSRDLRNMPQTRSISAEPVFWQRRTAAGRAGIVLLRAGLAVGVIIGLIEALGGGAVIRVYGWTIAVAIGVIGVIRAMIWWRRGGVWECRIDGGVLMLSREGEPPLEIEISTIEQWVRQRVEWGGSCPRESDSLRLRDGGRVRLDDYRFGRPSALRRVLRKLNPGMEVVTVVEELPLTREEC